MPALSLQGGKRPLDGTPSANVRPFEGRISHVAVVVPARNEAERIARAIRSIFRASSELRAVRPGVDISVVVVLDACDDGTREAAVDAAGPAGCLSLLDVRLHSAGASRAAGIRAALAATAAAPEQVWLANTDADSEVPPHWLCGQVELAESGADAVLGTVEPDPGELDGRLLKAWARTHRFTEDHSHVFGANFGVRASHYLRVGGFEPVRIHEDRILAERLRRAGSAVVATDTLRVVTSSRLQGRAPHGFAGYLRALGDGLGVPADAALGNGWEVP
ncbi:glycosyltransferase [Arthrobacter bambusae]|uniref:glycosyltransferase n=1 Tax=Arthrobacter bambusae TaxID=1338426 RepID=UPI00277D9586|nr:glycosyltransferase [Arthrobacter bambusae]MDQ0028473.1 glycosyltransferase involved in cell wall biosynthesis [Arthrobacter bambusae]MDQ0096732.1 glycosyltransferase involved in cell wall biosynthesis [Arthrobacter bambusae]